MSIASYLCHREQTEALLDIANQRLGFVRGGANRFEPHFLGIVKSGENFVSDLRVPSVFAGNAPVQDFFPAEPLAEIQHDQTGPDGHGHGVYPGPGGLCVAHAGEPAPGIVR
jgi:hypothetical protein